MGGSDSGNYGNTEIQEKQPHQKAGLKCLNFLCFTTGICRGQNPSVCYWKQGRPPRGAPRGKLCEQFAWREVGQGV